MKENLNRRDLLRNAISAAVGTAIGGGAAKIEQSRASEEQKYELSGLDNSLDALEDQATILIEKIRQLREQKAQPVGEGLEAAGQVMGRIALEKEILERTQAIGNAFQRKM